MTIIDRLLRACATGHGRRALINIKTLRTIKRDQWLAIDCQPEKRTGGFASLRAYILHSSSIIAEQRIACSKPTLSLPDLSLLLSPCGMPAPVVRPK